MRVAICSVGSELLGGDVVDTNAAWLARRVLESGCTMAATMIVGDDLARMVEALRWLADRADAIIVGGGLGPTADDVTRYAVAEFAGLELERHPDLVSHLDRVYARLERDMPIDALRQADVPSPCEVHDPEGTAAGFSLDVTHDGRTVRLHVLPGVPWEYQDLADRVVLPDLVRRSGGQARITRTLHVAGLGESGVGDTLRAISDRLEAARGRQDDPEHGIELGFLANDGEVLVRVTARGASPAEARDRAAPIVDEAARLLGEAVTSVDERTLEDEVAQLLVDLGATVATAEAFTAGRIAAAISSVPTSAAHLHGGLVAHTPRMLTELLGVDPDDVVRHGVVSRDVVAAMARSARRRCDADYAVAAVGVTELASEAVGVAGSEPPVGTAVWAVVGPDDVVHVEERFIPASDRAIVQTRGAAFALESLRRRLLAARHPDQPPAHVTP